MNSSTYNLVLLNLCLVFVKCSIVEFRTLSNLFLPFTYEPTEQYAFDMDAAEQMAYDAKNYIIYSVGHTNVHVIDISDVTNPQVLFHLSYDNVDVTDVEVCGDYVYVAYDNQMKQEEGFVEVYRLFNKTSNKLEVVNKIIVGPLPDMIHPTSDCKKLVVAIEAEPYVDVVNNRLVDNPGGVVIVTFYADAAGSYDLKTLGFEHFNARFDELSESGVRWIYRGENNSNPFSNDIEPEYITFNTDQSKAYIGLQENNAIAVVDMEKKEIEAIHGLGYKHWEDYSLDASDKDGGFNMRHSTKNLYGMYQPDAIKFLRHEHVNYLITANEGDSKDYPPYFSEESRVKDLSLSNVFEYNQTHRNNLKEDAELGRLTVTTENGQNVSSGEYNALYTFGARSFSIRNADTMKLLYDSGDDLEIRTGSQLPQVFNNGVSASDLARSTVDKRSDNMGPETESIAIAEVECGYLLMIGNERPGTIAVYSIDKNDDVPRPKFETIITGINSTDGTWETLYNNREIAMVDPEDMWFVPAADSPNNQPLLLVTGSESGTISILQMQYKCAEDVFGNNVNSIHKASTTILATLVLVLTMM